MTKTQNPNQYLEDLGYHATEGTHERNGRKVLLAECLYCGADVVREGPVLRGHRRNCEVHSFDPYTPGVCNA